MGGAGATPVLRVVSFHADDTNRSPTFDMELSELLKDGQPLSYSEARAYFRTDPATRSQACCYKAVTMYSTVDSTVCSLHLILFF